MFALIDTKNATHIAIYIPSDENCSESLSQLSLMFEHNATFYKSHWRSFELVKPQITITLGDKHEFDSSDEDTQVVVAKSNYVLDKNFSVDTVEVKASHEKARKAFEAKTERLRKEISSLKYENEKLQEKLENRLEQEEN